MSDDWRENRAPWGETSRSLEDEARAWEKAAEVCERRIDPESVVDMLVRQERAATLRLCAAALRNLVNG